MANFEAEKSATFNFSNTLFIDSSTNCPLQFHMMPCPHRAVLQPMVEFGGGSLSATAKDGIRLLQPGQTSYHDDNYSYKYIHDCVEQNQLLDLEQYRIPVGQTVTAYDNFDKDMENNHSIKLEGASGRTKYTVEEERAILNALLGDEQCEPIGGNLVWKQLETLKTTQHSWQSMKDHFRRIILPKIDSYNLPEEQKELLLNSLKKVSSNESNSSDSDSRAPVATSSNCQISLRSRAAEETSSAEASGQKSCPAVDKEKRGAAAASGSNGLSDGTVSAKKSGKSACNGQSETADAARTVDAQERSNAAEGLVQEQSPECLRKSPDAHSTPNESRPLPASTDPDSPLRVIGTIQAGPKRMIETTSDRNVAHVPETRGRPKKVVRELPLQVRGYRVTGESAAVAGCSKSLDGAVSSKPDSSKSPETAKSWPDGRTKAARLLKFAKSQAAQSEKEDPSRVVKDKSQPGKSKPVEEENERPRNLRSVEKQGAVATRSASADGQTEPKRLRSADRSDSNGHNSAISSTSVSPVRQRLQIPAATKVKSAPPRAIDIDTESRSLRSSSVEVASSRSHHEGKMSPKSSTDKASEANVSRRTAKAAAVTSTKDMSSRGPPQPLRSVEKSQEQNNAVQKWLRSGKTVSATSESDTSTAKTPPKRKLPVAQLEAKRPKSAEPVAGPSGLQKVSAAKPALCSSKPISVHSLRNRVVESPEKCNQSKTHLAKDAFAFSAKGEPVGKGSKALKIRLRLLTKGGEQSVEGQSSASGKVNGKSVAASSGTTQSSTSRGKGKALCQPNTSRSVDRSASAKRRKSTNRVSIEGIVERHETSLRNIVLNDRALETSDDEETADSYSDVEPSTNVEIQKKHVELIKMIAKDLHMSFKNFLQAVCINNGNITEAEHWVRHGTNRSGSETWDPTNDDPRLLHGDEAAFLSLVNKYGDEAVHQRLRFLTC